MLITDDIEEAKKQGDELWKATSEAEKKMKEIQDEEEKKKADEEAKNSEPEDDEDADDEDFDDEEDAEDKEDAEEAVSTCSFEFLLQLDKRYFETPRDYFLILFIIFLFSAR